ncbi:glycosyltransferase [Kocuria sp. M4R2S49]
MSPDWLTNIDQKVITLAGRSINVSIRPATWLDSDATIIGLKGTSLPVYKALGVSLLGRTRVGLWGHVRPYVNKGNAVDLLFERQQMKMANHIFAYTPGGHDYALAAGVCPNKVTTVMNSISTDELKANLESITALEVEEYSGLHGLDLGRTIGFIGGIDDSKRIDFLAQSLDELWVRDSRIKLLLGGKGVEQSKLDAHVRRGQVVPLGYLNVREKALVLRCSRLLCMPGRIGLVAVDSLVARVPIVTTDWPFHAPEAEYLREGSSRITAENSPEAYARQVMTILNCKGVPKTNTDDWVVPSLDDMVGNFRAGVIKLLTS